MKAMLLINHNGGNGAILKHLSFIKKSLKEKYSEIEIHVCEKEEEFCQFVRASVGHVDALIFAGGDGTFHLVINALKDVNNPPILGVIPSGTLCDAAKNFGINKNLKKALKVILNQKVKSFDVGKINDDYFIFSSSIGAYSDIPYSVCDSSKKKFGHFAYYFKAIPQLFDKRKININLTLENNEKRTIETPFLLVMNSSYMAGFKINKKGKVDDGVIDLFYSKCEPFNGLLSYFLFKKRVEHVKVKSCEIEVLNDDCWDIDGELFKAKNVTLNVIPNRFKMFYKNKNN